MLTSDEEASLRDSLRFRERDRWLHLLYRREPFLPCLAMRHCGTQGARCVLAADALPASVVLEYLRCTLPIRSLAMPPVSVSSSKHLPQHVCRGCSASSQEDELRTMDGIVVTLEAPAAPVLAQGGAVTGIRHEALCPVLSSSDGAVGAHAGPSPRSTSPTPWTPRWPRWRRRPPRASTPTRTLTAPACARAPARTGRRPPAQTR